MTSSHCAVVTLLVALVVGVQGHQIIYVDTENGTLNSSCWEGGLDQPCGSLELASTGAQRYKSTIAFLWRYETNYDTAITAPIAEQAMSSPPLPTMCDSICRCHEQANNDSMSPQLCNASCPPWFEPLVNVGQLFMTLSNVMKHCQNLPYYFVDNSSLTLIADYHNLDLLL